MSYLFFDPGFLEAAIEQGQQDATAVLEAAPPGTLPWRTHGPGGTDGGGDSTPPSPLLPGSGKH
jgi:NTE family protein